MMLLVPWETKIAKARVLICQCPQVQPVRDNIHYNMYLQVQPVKDGLQGKEQGISSEVTCQ